MLLRKMTVVCGVIAAGAIAGMVGQSLVAQAGAPAPSDKTLYAKVNAAFTYNVTKTLNTPKTLLKITVHAPSAGQVEVFVDSQLWTDFPSSTTNELENVLTVARCTQSNTLASGKCNGSTTYWFHKAQNAGGNDSTEPYSISALMGFSSAGRQSMYLNAEADTYAAGLWGDTSAHIQVAFTPRHPISASAHVTVAATTPGSV